MESTGSKYEAVREVILRANVGRMGFDRYEISGPIRVEVHEGNEYSNPEGDHYNDAGLVETFHLKWESKGWVKTLLLGFMGKVQILDAVEAATPQGSRVVKVKAHE
jgi:hypothetical protein